MPQFTHNGITYEELPDGNVRVVGYADAPQPGVSVTPLPASPDKIRQQGREAGSDSRDETRTGIAVRGEQRDVTKTGNDFLLRIGGDYNADPAVKTYRIAIQQLAQAIGTGTGPQADLALTYAFAKAMDPDSVVRESEQGMVTGSQPWFQAAVEKTKKQFGMDGAGNFTPEARDALRKQISNSVAQRAKVYDARRDYYRQQASAIGADPELVIGEHDATPFVPALQEWVEAVNAPKDQGLPTGEAKADEGLAGNVTYEGPNDYSQSPLGQGVSGVNKGIAGTLGLPVDLLTAGMNLVPKTINAAANTNIPEITDPIGGGEWFKDRFDDLGFLQPKAETTTGQFADRVGQSLGASLIPLGAMATPGKLALGALGATSGGVGAATAQQMFPGNPAAEFAGELIGSGTTLPGALGLARRSAQRGIEAAVPSVPQLKEQAGEMYRAAEARGVTADPMQTEALRDSLIGVLRGEGRVSPTGRISEVYPKAKDAMQLVEDYSGQPMSPTQLQTVRSVIADGMKSPDSSERRISSMMLDEFDTWANPLAPELPAARDVASRYLNAEKLETARELAGARAGQFSGSGYENALRTEYRALDRNTIKGRERFGDELTGAIEDVSRGTPMSNAARNVGRLAPTTPWNFTMTTALPAAVGTMMGGPMGGLIAGGAANVLGQGARTLATQMGVRSAGMAELIARNGGRLPEMPIIDDATRAMLAALSAGQGGQYLGEGAEGQPAQNHPAQPNPDPFAGAEYQQPFLPPLRRAPGALALSSLPRW